MNRLLVLALLTAAGCGGACEDAPSETPAEAAVAPPPEPTRPVKAPAPRGPEMQAQHDTEGWPSTSLRLDDGRLLYAAVRARPGADEPDVVLAVRGPDGAQQSWRGADAVSGAERPDGMWGPATRWTVRARRVPGTPLVRVGFTGTHGDDVETTSEALLVLDGRTLERVWAGVGEHVTDEMGRCRSGHEVELSRADDGLEVRRVGFANWNELGRGNSQTPDFDHLKARCTPPADEVHRVPFG